MPNKKPTKTKKKSKTAKPAETDTNTKKHRVISPTRRVPQRAASEAKLNQSDMYLKRLQQNQYRIKRTENREKLKELERELELSQMSSWTGDSLINIQKQGKVERIKGQKSKIIDDLQSVTLPDRETLLDTIVNLRQQKNVYEEQLQLFKVSNARYKKLLILA